MLYAHIERFRRIAAPALAVFNVEIPLAADRLFVLLDQHLVDDAHLAVEVFHQPLLAVREDALRFVPFRKEVFAVGHNGARDSGELPVEAPFVGGLVFKSAGVVPLTQPGHVVGNRMRVGRVVDGQVVNLVAGLV